MRGKALQKPVSIHKTRDEDEFIGNTSSDRLKGCRRAHSDANTSCGDHGNRVDAKTARSVRLNLGGSKLNAISTNNSKRRPSIQQRRQESRKRRPWGAGPGTVRCSQTRVGRTRTSTDTDPETLRRRVQASEANVSLSGASPALRDPGASGTINTDFRLFLPTWSALVSEAEWLRGGRAEGSGDRTEGKGKRTTEGSSEHSLRARVRRDPVMPVINPEVQRLLAEWIRSKLGRCDHAPERRCRSMCMCG